MKEELILLKLADLESHLKKSNDQPLNINEAAEYLKVSQSNLYRLTSHKLIPFYKPAGKLIYFFKSELDKWITKNEELARQSRGEVKSEVKDPNQIEMELKDIGESRPETGDRKRNDEVLVIEFPMKRKKRQTDISSQQSENK